MSGLLDHIRHNLAARRLFRRGQRILVAVSGGVDSMVLLGVLHELTPENGWRLTVAHLNHGLRGRSSEADERLVRRTAQELGLPVEVERVPPGGMREFARAHKLSLEMAAREVRHDFLARTARRLGTCSVALAHHADDQVELFFLRLLRGSGGEGLAGMKWRNPSASNSKVELVRPLLDVPKRALGEYARAMRIRFREDATNASLDIQRNRIRQELLPLLRRKYQPALEKTVARAMEIVGAEGEFVTRAAIEWLARNPKSEIRSPKSRIRRARFEDLPIAVQRRCVQLQLWRLGVEGDFDLVEQLRHHAGRRVAIGRREGRSGPPRPHYLSRAQGFDYEDEEEQEQEEVYTVREVSGLVRVQKAKQVEFKAGSREVELDRAGEVTMDGVGVRWHIKGGKPTGPPGKAAGREIFDADRVGSRIVLRHWQPGDRFQPSGMDASVKLQDIFTNQRVPRARRHELLVAATAQGDIFWVEGLRISERFKLTKSTIRRLHWRWQRLVMCR